MLAASCSACPVSDLARTLAAGPDLPLPLQSVYNATQDDATFKHLASVYARRNPQMLNNPVCARQGKRLEGWQRVVRARCPRRRAGRAGQGALPGRLPPHPRVPRCSSPSVCAALAPPLRTSPRIACRSFPGPSASPMGRTGTSSTEACRQGPAGASDGGVAGKGGGLNSKGPGALSAVPQSKHAAGVAMLGGAQDWNYVKAGCFEVTLELWNVKGEAASGGVGARGLRRACWVACGLGCGTTPQRRAERTHACCPSWLPSGTPKPARVAPPPSGAAPAAGAANLAKLFKNNLDSMTSYALTSTFGGLRGTVKQRSTGKPLTAAITGGQSPVNGRGAWRHRMSISLGLAPSAAAAVPPSTLAWFCPSAMPSAQSATAASSPAAARPLATFTGHWRPASTM